METLTEKHAAEARAECKAVNNALYATREHGLIINDELESAWNGAKKVGTREAGLAFLRNAWMGVQAQLEIVQKAHPGAMKYFVEIKDMMKGDIEKWPPRAGA